MAHSGWRDPQRHLGNTVCAMEKLLDRPGQVIAAFVPACGNRYEVGRSSEDFSKRFSADERRLFFRPKER